MARVLARLFWFLVLCGWANPLAAQANPQVLVPGYTLVRISDAVNSDRIAQLAFDPNDSEHLYVARTQGSVMRYDYDPVTGNLENDLVVRDFGEQLLGLAFHDGDLYVSLNLGGSPGDGRISRLSNPNGNGVFQTRHDFVHSIPLGNHKVDHLQIVGDTLYVGIGAVGRKGDPSEENIYSMTIARIVDLTQVDFSGPIGGNFKGPVNHLADPTEWINTAGNDGRLRYYASGLRNPFGIAIDSDGDLWVSTNGNSDAGFLSPDYLYKKVELGAQGDFPPSSFGFGPPHITGTPIQHLADLGQNPAPTGLDFVPVGPDRGKVILAQAGAANQSQYPVGKDVLLVDPDNGAFQVLIDELDQPTDVVQDPFGRLLVADYRDDSVWLLTPPPPRAPSGRVPGEGVPLLLAVLPDGDLFLDWSDSCAPGDVDYEIYEGPIGAYDDHGKVLCSTGGMTSTSLAPSPGDTYYLVVPTNTDAEGSYGLRTGGTERPPGDPFCLPQGIVADCP